MVSDFYISSVFSGIKYINGYTAVYDYMIEFLYEFFPFYESIKTFIPPFICRLFFRFELSITTICIVLYARTLVFNVVCVRRYFGKIVLAGGGVVNCSYF